MAPGARPLTILHVHNSRIVGGVEVSIIGWMRHLDRTRFVPLLFCFEEADGAESPLLAYVERRNIPIHVLPWGGRKRLIRAVSQLVRVIRANQPCIVHTHDHRPDLVGWLAARVAGCPWMASVHAWHSVWPGLSRKRQLLEAIRGRLLRRCNVVAAVSEGLRLETIRRGVPPARAMTLYTGISLDELGSSVTRDAARQALGFEPQVVLIGNIARLHPEKGQMLLLQAFARASPSIPRARLLIAGDGTLAARLRGEAERLGIVDRVSFIGFQHDLASLLSALDLFALPSFAEGTPLVIYAAMAAGLPILASDVGGIGELLRHEESAVLVPPGDERALVEALVRLGGDDVSYRSSLGARARHIADTDPRCSNVTSTRRLETIYEELWIRHDAAARA